MSKEQLGCIAVFDDASTTVSKWWVVNVLQFGFYTSTYYVTVISNVVKVTNDFIIVLIVWFVWTLFDLDNETVVNSFNDMFI